jgi:hypothetical protein
MVLPESHERYWTLAWSSCLHRPKITNERIFPDIPIRIIMMSIYTRKKSVNAFRADMKGSGGAQNVDVNSIAVILDTWSLEDKDINWYTTKFDRVRRTSCNVASETTDLNNLVILESRMEGYGMVMTRRFMCVTRHVVFHPYGCG